MKEITNGIPFVNFTISLLIIRYFLAINHLLQIWPYKRFSTTRSESLVIINEDLNDYAKNVETYKAMSDGYASAYGINPMDDPYTFDKISKINKISMTLQK